LTLTESVVPVADPNVIVTTLVDGLVETPETVLDVTGFGSPLVTDTLDVLILAGTNVFDGNVTVIVPPDPIAA
jgi:hypothetical protein